VGCPVIGDDAFFGDLGNFGEGHVALVACDGFEVAMVRNWSLKI
jgi:hypothetical protein